MNVFKMKWTIEIICTFTYLYICTFCNGTIEGLRSSSTGKTRKQPDQISTGNSKTSGDCSSVANQDYTIVVEYTASFENGTTFIPKSDTSTEEPFQFVLGNPGVQESWNSELTGACLGETRRIEVPKSQLSQEKIPTVPPDNDVIFVITIVDIIPPITTERKPTTQVKLTDEQEAAFSSSKLLTTLVSGFSLKPSVTMVTNSAIKDGINTKYPNKPVGKFTSDPKTTKSGPGEVRIIQPDDNITPNVQSSTKRKITTRAVEGDDESRGDTAIVPPPGASDASPTPKVNDTDDEYVTEYYMEEITVTVSPDDDPDDDPNDTGSKGKPAVGKKTGPKVRRKNNGFIYYHMQYIAIPVAIILLLLVVYCLYTVEFPDRKVKFYRVRDHDPVLDGPL